ncbi:MAG: peptide-methionine (S)-S-oxide reductase MsrA [Cyanobacteria bacterium P01_D01_bin.115]
MNRRWINVLFGVIILWFGFTAPVNAAAEGPPATAVFAGGCFWCMEQPFDELPGVIDTTSGYTGGTVENPGYYQVSAGGTGHVEAVQVTYEPSQVSYETLLDVFWHNVDPVDGRGQFCDKGNQYQSAIFYQNEAQRAAAIASKATLSDSGQLAAEVATDIRAAATFYPAEGYHQNYYKTHPVRYKVYRFGCGRDQRLSKIWGENAEHS